MPLTYEAYKANNDIQTTIIGLGMDPDKFWYALLFIKDYTDGECAQEYKKESFPISELRKFVETISNYEIAECNPLIEEVQFSKEIELSILVDDKTEITIKSPNAIKYIQSLCRNSLAQTNAMCKLNAEMIKDYFDSNPSNRKGVATVKLNKFKEEQVRNSSIPK